ncbi:MAG: PP2C family protein-serine/threonine phosphatase, partial [Candidatus Eisenbacteria bacterium]
LPDHLPRLENYRLAARLLPCLETAGDFFDIGERADGAVEVLIGDVSGKGVGAALLMSHTVAAYRVLSQEGHALSELMDRLCCHVYASSDATRFVTLFASRLDLEKHELRYVNGGHSPVLIVHADGSCDRLPATGPAVGLIDGCSFEEQRLPLGPGSVVCFYTDGIIEAGQDDPYEEERLRAVLERSRDLSPEQIIDAILEDVHRHTGRSERDDDITVVVLKRVS